MTHTSGRRGWPLLLALTLGVTWSVAARAADKAPELPADLRVVPGDAFLVGSVHLGELWAGETGKELLARLSKDSPEALASLTRDVGLAPGEINRVTIYWGGPRDANVTLVTAKEPINRARVVAALAPGAKEERGAFFGKSPQGVVFLGERTFAHGGREQLTALLQNPVGKQGPLTPALREAAAGRFGVLSLNVPLLKQVAKGDLPPPLHPLLDATQTLVTLDLKTEPRADLSANFANDAEAQAATKTLRTLLDMAVQNLATVAQQPPPDLAAPAFANALKELGAGLRAASLTTKENRVEASLRVKVTPKAMQTVLIDGVLKTRQAAARAQATNNLKQLGLAMHNYHDAYRTFPPHAIYSADGKPLLSWRVMVLPFIEQEGLYKEFKLDEPWDSEHNKKLLGRMPRVFALPTQAANETRTHYQSFHGEGAFFSGRKGLAFTEIFDGASNTIMLAEGATAVPWTKPEDLPYAAGKPLPKLGAQVPGAFLAAYADGSVRVIQATIKEEVLRALITVGGGEVIGPLE